jgi:hypothetical protein
VSLYLTTTAAKLQQIVGAKSLVSIACSLGIVRSLSFVIRRTYLLTDRKVKGDSFTLLLACEEAAAAAS